MKTTLRSTVVLLVIAIVNLYAAPIKVFILAGQSNMEGVGIPCDLPTMNVKNNGVFSNIIVYSSIGGDAILHGPEILKAPLSSGQHFGPEIGIGEVLSEVYKGETICFIKIAYGATELKRSWLADCCIPAYDSNLVETSPTNLKFTHGLSIM